MLRRSQSYQLVARTLAIVVSVACGGDGRSDSTELPTPSTAPLTGALDVVVSGLTGADGAVQVSGPGGFFRVITASERFTGLATTTYSVVASPVQSALYDFAATPQQFATVGAGTTTTVNVVYTATTGALALSMGGLPAERTASVNVSNAGRALTMSATSVTGRLTPGVYSVLPQSVPDVSLRYTAPTTLVTITAGITRTLSIDYQLLAAARTTTDRADDVTGAQLKVLYAVPSDGTDRGLDTTGVLQRSTSSWQRWLASQTGSRYVRLETVGGSLDVLFVRLPRPDAVYRNFGAAIRDSLERDLSALGIVAATTQKIYLVYYDGGHNDRCGSAALPPNVPGRVAAIYLQGTILGGANCNTNPFASRGTSPAGYLEFVAAHEVLHLLGMVSAAAPDQGLGGHLITDPGDLMYAGTAPWTPSRVDGGGRNYFNPSGLPGGMANFATSPFVITP